MIKFSVLMPVYHKENAQYLDGALTSVVSQSAKPDEIVIVKDGALTEAPEKVINKYLDEHRELFKTVQLDQNYGLGKALRIGVENCSNEYIARMDGDDICLPERFAAQLKAFEDNLLLSLAGGQIEEFENEINSAYGRRSVPLSHEDILRRAKRRNPFNHMTVMFKKSDALAAGNYMEMPLCEDYYLWARMLKNGCQALNLPQTLVYARAGNEMVKRRGGLKYIKYVIKCYRSFYELGFISMPEYFINCLIRISAGILPGFLRLFLYRKFLRSKLRG